MERANLIRASSLFAGLPAAEITRLALHARRRYFSRNESLFMQGEPMQSLVLLESGWVKMTQNSLNGSEMIVATRGPGEIVQSPGGPNVDRHTVSASAAVGCTALIWVYPTIYGLVTESIFTNNLCHLLAMRCCELQDRYHEMSTERVERRVALTLIRLAGQYGTRTHSGVEVSISRQDLALMTGTTLFAVSRLMSMWSKNRLVAAGRETFLMLDAEGLEALTATEKANEKMSNFGAIRKPLDPVRAQRLC